MHPSSERLAVLGQGHLDTNAGPSVWRRTDVERSADEPGALVHALHAAAAHGGRLAYQIEPAAVVADVDVDPLLRSPGTHPDAPGGGVATSGGKRLADDPKYLDARAAQGPRGTLLSHFQLDVAVGHGAVEHYQRLKLSRKRLAFLFVQAKVVDGAAQLLPDPLQCGHKRGGRVEIGDFGACAFCQVEGVGELLQGFVVKVPGDSPPFRVAYLLETCFRVCPLHSGREHVGHRLQEVEVVPGEGVAPCRKGPERAKRLTASRDHDHRAAHHAAVRQQRRDLEALVGGKLFGHDRPAGIDRVVDQRAKALYVGGVPDIAPVPALARAQQYLLPPRWDLRDTNALDVERARHQGDRLLQQRLEVIAGERPKPQVGYQRLLARSVLTLLLGPLAIGDISVVDRQPRSRRVRPNLNPLPRRWEEQLELHRILRLHRFAELVPGLGGDHVGKQLPHVLPENLLALELPTSPQFQATQPPLVDVGVAPASVPCDERVGDALQD